jgi:hypothetical protein
MMELELDREEVKELRSKARAAKSKANVDAAWEDKRRRALISDLGEVGGMRIFEREKAGGFEKLWPHPAVGK